MSRDLEKSALTSSHEGLQHTQISAESRQTTREDAWISICSVWAGQRTCVGPPSVGHGSWVFLMHFDFGQAHHFQRGLSSALKSGASWYARRCSAAAVLWVNPSTDVSCAACIQTRLPSSGLRASKGW